MCENHDMLNFIEKLLPMSTIETKFILPHFVLTKLEGSTKLWSIIFDGEMLIRTSPTTLLQIFCKIIVNSKDMFKRIIDQYDNW